LLSFQHFLWFLLNRNHLASLVQVTGLFKWNPLSDCSEQSSRKCSKYSPWALTLVDWSPVQTVPLAATTATACSQPWHSNLTWIYCPFALRYAGTLTSLMYRSALEPSDILVLLSYVAKGCHHVAWQHLSWSSQWSMLCLIL
jgi:hypothetical protein